MSTCSSFHDTFQHQTLMWECMQDNVLMHLGVLLVQVINQWLWRLWHAASGAAARVYGFLCGVCCTSERPLHFVKVDLLLGDGEHLS